MRTPRKPSPPARRLARRLAIVTCLAVFLALALAGCSEEALFGNGPGAEAEASTPAGVQSGKVMLVFTLSHESITENDVDVGFSTNGGATFRPASESSGGTGTAGLAVAPEGASHVFEWDSATDLGPGRFEEVRLRVSPDSGESATTQPFSVHNTVFLAASAVTDTDDSRLGVYELDLTDGSVELVTERATGGRGAWDVLELGGVFYVANATTNDVAALRFDELEGSLTPLAGSPTSTAGIGTRHLATDGDLLFAANGGGGTISVFSIGAEGELTLQAAAGIAAPGGRSMAVRGGRLYVACETAGEIVILDIEDGQLVPNSFSPVALASLPAPRALEPAGSFLYAADAGAAGLVALRFLGGGDLEEVAGSPFAVAAAGVEEIAARDSDRLILAGGAAASFSVIALTAGGVATSTSGSPFAASGPVTGVVAVRDVVVAATSTGRSIDSRRFDDTGALVPAPGSPLDAGNGVRRLAVTD